MNPTLARVLIQKGAIRQDTLLEAYHNSHGLSYGNDSRVLGKFLLIQARALKDGTVAFDVHVKDQTECLRLSSTDVLAVDGMDIRRFAGTYNLFEDGTKMPEQKRRGRRPRALVEAMRLAAELQAGAAPEPIETIETIEAVEADSVPDAPVAMAEVVIEAVIEPVLDVAAEVSPPIAASSIAAEPPKSPGVPLVTVDTSVEDPVVVPRMEFVVSGTGATLRLPVVTADGTVTPAARPPQPLLDGIGTAISTPLAMAPTRQIMRGTAASISSWGLGIAAGPGWGESEAGRLPGSMLWPSSRAGVGPPLRFGLETQGSSTTAEDFARAAELGSFPFVVSGMPPPRERKSDD